MAEFVKMKVFGLKELERALEGLPKATAKATLRVALKKAAQPVADAAASMAPVRTGRLSESISVRTQLSKRQRRGRKERGAVVLHIGAETPRAPHAHLVEFGTRFMPARPFLRPAWDGKKDGVLASIKTNLWSQIEKTRRRLAKRAAKVRARR